MNLLLVGASVVAGVVIAARLGAWLLGVRYIPHTKVGIVEKLWAPKGSLTEGRIIAANGEAGYQTEILRGGVHALYYPWQFRIHREPLVSIPEGKIGYVYSRDGRPLAPAQTLGRVTACNNFQDARAFLETGGQRGRQRAILREGVYAINLALFVVVAEDRVYQGPVPEKNPAIYAGWQAQLRAIDGFDPVVVGTGSGVPHDGRDDTAANPSTAASMRDDDIAVITVHDGAPIESGEVIAPEVHAAPGQADHVDISIAGNRGEAQLAEARRLAERDVARADGEARARELLGRGEASRIAQTGVAEAGVFLKKIRAYGDPRLFAVNLLSEQMAHSQQPLVPQRVLMMGADGNGGPLAGMSLFGKLLALLLAEKGGLGLAGDPGDTADLEQFVNTLTGAADGAAAAAPNDAEAPSAPTPPNSESDAGV